MPRDGSGVYSHPFPNVVEGTTIESAVFNGNTSDVEQDLNTPRPIVAGGTGASDAHQALINLHGEESNQLVTNYDSFPFVAGSFYSAPGATGAPEAASSYAGICYTYSTDGSSMTLEARAFTGAVVGPLYVRQKKGGTWGAWQQQSGSAADLDTTYVNASGDTMTGNLKLTNADPAFTVDKPVGAGHAATLLGTMNGSARWMVQIGDGNAESGGNLGSDFRVIRFNDAGTSLDTSNLIIDRSTGSASFSNGVTAGASGTSGAYGFGSTNTKYLQYDGTSFRLNGGPLFVTSTAGQYANVNAGVFSSVLPANAAAGTVLFGNSGRSLASDGSIFVLNCNGAFIVNNVATEPKVTFQRNGVTGPAIGQSATSWNFYTDAGHTMGMYLLPNGTAWASFSDARLSYKADASPVSDVLSRLGGVQLYRNVGPGGTVEMFFKAQELATTLPEIVLEPTGPQARDASYVPEGLGDANVWGITYDRSGAVALQAVKELLARVQALEAKLGQT